MTIMTLASSTSRLTMSVPTTPTPTSTVLATITQTTMDPCRGADSCVWDDDGTYHAPEESTSALE